MQQRERERDSIECNKISEYTSVNVLGNIANSLACVRAECMFYDV